MKYYISDFEDIFLYGINDDKVINAIYSFYRKFFIRWSWGKDDIIPISFSESKGVKNPTLIFNAGQAYGGYIFVMIFWDNCDVSLEVYKKLPRIFDGYKIHTVKIRN